MFEHYSAHYCGYISRCDHNIRTQSTQETIPMGALGLFTPTLPLLAGLGILTLLTPQKAQGVILDRWDFRLNMYKVVQLWVISP